MNHIGSIGSHWIHWPTGWLSEMALGPPWLFGLSAPRCSLMTNLLKDIWKAQSDKYYDEIRDEICDELMGTSSALHGFWVFTLVMSNVSLQFLYQANASSALER